MARLEKLNCSNCGASLDVDLDAQIIQCRFCGTRLLLEREPKSPFTPGIITNKHAAEVRQWLEKLGIEKDIGLLELVYLLDLRGKEIDFRDLRYLEYFPNLTLLNLQETNLNDDGTPYLKTLAGLEGLYLGSTAVSDLAFTGAMEKMDTIHAEETKVNDGGLGGIRNLAKLKTLDLRNTQVTDAGMEHLKNLKSLESLDIEGTLVGVDGLKLLAGLPGLKELRYPKDIKDIELLRAGILGLCKVKSVINLSCQKIDDSDLKELDVLKRIEMLDLRSNRITDNGLECLKIHGYLNYLDLSLNKITDAGIEHLAGLTRLATLDLRGNEVTDKGVKRLKKLLPKATIHA